MTFRPYDELAHQLALADELAAALKLENEALRAQLRNAQEQMGLSDLRAERLAARLADAAQEIEDLETCNQSMQRAINHGNALDGTALDAVALARTADAVDESIKRMAAAQAAIGELELEDPT